MGGGRPVENKTTLGCYCYKVKPKPSYSNDVRPEHSYWLAGFLAYESHHLGYSLVLLVGTARYIISGSHFRSGH
jgi:hypothetical protein